MSANFEPQRTAAASRDFLAIARLSCLYMVSLNKPSISHGRRDNEPQRYWGHHLDLLGVTWRHQSRDHWTGNVCFPIGSQFEPTVYLARFSERFWGHDFDLLGHVTSSIARRLDSQYMVSYIGVLLKPTGCLTWSLRYVVSNI